MTSMLEETELYFLLHPVLSQTQTNFKAVFISKPNLSHMFALLRLESKMSLALIDNQGKIFSMKMAKRIFSTLGKYI